MSGRWERRRPADRGCDRPGRLAAYSSEGPTSPRTDHGEWLRTIKAGSRRRHRTKDRNLPGPSTTPPRRIKATPSPATSASPGIRLTNSRTSPMLNAAEATAVPTHSRPIRPRTTPASAINFRLAIIESYQVVVVERPPSKASTAGGFGDRPRNCAADFRCCAYATPSANCRRMSPGARRNPEKLYPVIHRTRQHFAPYADSPIDDTAGPV